MIVLEMKCPQLSKPEATAARNENSIGDRMEKKPWEKPGSVGGPVPLRPDKSVVPHTPSVRLDWLKLNLEALELPWITLIFHIIGLFGRLEGYS